MPFHGRAYYNKLQLEGPSSDQEQVEPWQIEDYRALETQALFNRLHQHGIDLDLESFELYSRSVESPHELMLNLLPTDANAQLQAQVFLLVFELWRRLIEGRLCLSIFCDEIDYQITQYEEDNLDDEMIGVVFSRLEGILDGSVDEGQSPEEVFKLVKTFFAHDIEEFLFNFCSHLIDSDHRTLASELIEGYYDFIEDKPWFDFLRMRLLAEEDLVEADTVITRFFVNLMEAPDFDLGIELLEFLASVGKSQLFYQVYQVLIPLVQTEDEFKEMLKTVAGYYSDVNFEMEHDFVHKILAKHSDIDVAEKKKLEQMILDTLDK